MNKDHADLPVFVRWMEYLHLLGQITDKMPKKVRFSLSDRVYNLSLDVVEKLVEARYSKNKRTALAGVNLSLEKIRVLLRVAHGSKYLCTNDFYKVNNCLFEVGKMVGGWNRSLDQDEKI